MFEAIGDKPRWALTLDVFREHETGETVTYKAIGEALGTTDRRIIQASAREASKRLLREDDKAIEAVPNKGYRIVTAEEHIRLAKSQEKRSRRALVKGHATVTHVDVNGLSPEAQRIMHATGQGFARVLDMMRATERNVKRVERAQEALELRVDDQLSDAAERLAQLEAKVARLAPDSAA